MKPFQMPSHFWNWDYSTSISGKMKFFSTAIFFSISLLMLHPWPVNLIEELYCKNQILKYIWVLKRLGAIKKKNLGNKTNHHHPKKSHKKNPTHWRFQQSGWWDTPKLVALWHTKGRKNCKREIKIHHQGQRIKGKRENFLIWLQKAGDSLISTTLFIERMA